MSYAPGFVNIVCCVGIILLSRGILLEVSRRDKDWQDCNPRYLWGSWFMACVLGITGFLLCAWDMNLFPKICFLLLTIYLVVSSVMDYMLCIIYSFMQYMGILGGVLWILYDLPQSGNGWSLLFFALVQYVIFGRMYGGGDVIAFLICALYLTGREQNIEVYLFHMAACYLLLGVVQALKGNISKKGNLKKTVALYPYISTSFLLIFYQ